MTPSTPHYLLFSESDSAQGVWKFQLRSDTGAQILEVADCEPATQGDRLELLTVVRGLEALDQPSKVTLMTPSKYVREGIRFGLSEWQANGWRWEFFGEMVPVKNRDLWQRVERALRFHEVQCRVWRFDPPHTPPIENAAPQQKPEPAVDPPDRKNSPNRDPVTGPLAPTRARAPGAAIRNWLGRVVGGLRALAPEVSIS